MRGEKVARASNLRQFARRFRSFFFSHAHETRFASRAGNKIWKNWTRVLLDARISATIIRGYDSPSANLPAPAWIISHAKFRIEVDKTFSRRLETGGNNAIFNRFNARGDVVTFLWYPLYAYAASFVTILFTFRLILELILIPDTDRQKSHLYFVEFYLRQLTPRGTRRGEINYQPVWSGGGGGNTYLYSRGCPRAPHRTICWIASDCQTGRHAWLTGCFKFTTIFSAEFLDSSLLHLSRNTRTVKPWLSPLRGGAL